MSAEIIKANFGGAPFREMDELQEGIWDAIMEFEGRVSTMGVIGVLRLIEHRLLTNVHNEGEI